MRIRLRTVIAYLFVYALVFQPPLFSQTNPTLVYKVPLELSDGWRTGNADSAGLDSTRLANLTQSLRAWPELGVHAALIERGGRLIYEEYFDGFDEKWGQPLGPLKMTSELKHDLRSVTKSEVSALVGIAHGEGAIESLNEPVIQWFPEYPELNTPERR